VWPVAAFGWEDVAGVGVNEAIPSTLVERPTELSGLVVGDCLVGYFSRGDTKKPAGEAGLWCVGEYPAGLDGAGVGLGGLTLPVLDRHKRLSISATG